MTDKIGIVASLTASWLLVACANAQTGTEQEMKQDQKNAAADSGLSVHSEPTVIGELGAAAEKGSSEVSPGPGLQRLVDLATKDLSAKLGVEPAGIEVMQAEYVSWRDSAIGCPQPGYQYLQVITNGSRIVLSANKQVYHYHSGGNRPPSLCKKPSATAPLPYAPGEI